MMNIDAVLSGQAGLAGLQWILHGPLMRDVLQGELSDLLAPGNQVRSLHLRRAKFKPNRKLTAYYDVVLDDGQDRRMRAQSKMPGRVQGEDSVRPIAVTWTPQGKDTWPEAKPILLEMQAEICAQGLAAPFRQLMTEVRAWNMGIQIYPLDGHFPQLMRLASLQYARDIVATYDGGRLSQGEASSWEGCPNPEYPTGRLRTSITPIRYRPRQRHILRYNSVSETQWANPFGGRSVEYGAQPPGEKTIFAKLYNSEKGAQTFRVVTQVADRLERCSVGVTALRPLAYLAADKTVLYPHLAGAPLSHYLQYSKDDVERYLWQAGAALRALHVEDFSPLKRGLASELKVHTFAAEVKLVARASEHIQALLPAVGKKIDEILEHLQALYASLPPESPTFTHKDFKADHIWVTPAGLTLIDFDSCCLADAALDVGKFLADLQWWYSMGRLGPIQPDRPAPSVEKVQACFLAGYDGGISPAPQNFHLLRSRLYEVLWLVKMGARRFRLYAPGWEERTEQAIRKAESALNMITVKEGYNEKS